MHKKKIRIVPIILICIAVFLIVSVLVLATFDHTGYRMTVKFHGFTEVSDNVYIDKNYSQDTSQALDILEKAKDRVRNYFGEIKSRPVIIITDDQKKIDRLGGDHDTMLVAAGQFRAYTALSTKWLTVDVAAHEMTHAEEHTRADSGKLGTKSSLPVWFDEGLAMQNDYREKYDYQAHINDFPEDMISSVDFSKLSDADFFYLTDDTHRYFNYLVSKQKVTEILSEKTDHTINEMLDMIKSGQSFDSVFGLY